MKPLNKEELLEIAAKETPHQKPEEVFFFFDFLEREKFKIETIVEIGTALGGMASMFKIYFPEARVVSVDIEANAEAQKKSQERGWEYVIGNSHAERTLTKVLGIVGTIDLLFIDGSHQYEDVKQDWQMWGKHAKIVAFHDIVWNCGKPSMSTATVYQLWYELRDWYKPDNVREIICSAYGGLVEHSGIGVVWQTE